MTDIVQYGRTIFIYIFVNCYTLRNKTTNLQPQLNEKEGKTTRIMYLTLQSCQFRSYIYIYTMYMYIYFTKQMLGWEPQLPG